MNGSPPACSVIVPAYKTTAYIAETLESIFAQTFQNFEIIVANDGCPDTENLERVLAPYRHRIVYLTQQNGGLGAARNLAIRASQAPVIALLDSDDLFEPDYLATQLAVLDANPQVDVACCDATYFGDKTMEGKLFSQVCLSNGEINFANVVHERVHVFVAVTARTAVFEKAGLFFPLREIQGSDDYSMWLKLTLQGKLFHYTDKPLVRYRRHHTSMSANDIGMINSNLAALKAVRAWAPSLTPEQCQVFDEHHQHLIGKLGLYQAKQDLRDGNYESAKANLMVAVAHYDSSLRMKIIAQLTKVAPGLMRAVLIAGDRRR